MEARRRACIAEQAVVSAPRMRNAARPITALLLDGIRGTRPLPVLMAELVAGLRAWARERTVPAD